MYTQGIAVDGVAILKEGVAMVPEEILSELNALEIYFMESGENSEFILADSLDSALKRWRRSNQLKHYSERIIQEDPMSINFIGRAIR